MRALLLLVAVAMLVRGSTDTRLVKIGSKFVRIKKLKPHPEHPNQCYDPGSKRAHAVGQVWQRPGRCMRLKCLKPDVDYRISAVLCPLFVLHPKCKLEGDRRKSFPDCCPREICWGRHPRTRRGTTS